MSIDNKSDDLFWWIIIFSLFENEQQKWDQLRNKETELLKLAQQEYTEYFDQLFQHGIPTLYKPVQSYFVQDISKAVMFLNLESIFQMLWTHTLKLF